MKKYLLSVFFAFLFQIINAQVVLPKIIADNMVMQRNVPIPIWGWSSANEKIEIKFKQQIKKTTADKNGKWIVKLDAERAGGPFELFVKGKNSIKINNVLVGEVWICSGQSNMEWNVGSSLNAVKEIENANYPFIHQIKISRSISSLPEKDFKEGNWKICNPTTVGDFTAIGYFFAKRLFDSLKVPIGIINSSWGGTNIETWISREGFESSDEYKEMIASMPKINLDSLSQLNIKGSELRIEALQGTKFKDLILAQFKDLSFDDAKWPTLHQPQLWEQQSIGELDGVVWLRKSFELSASDFNKEAALQLSKVDDEDITYINGVKVGSTSQWDAKRNYIIPTGILKEGKNIIAVRVVDNGGGGGIYGNDADLRLTINNIIIPLSGTWKFQVESIKKTTNENSFPSLCYNAMIQPLIPFAFKGVLWYQGESNAGRAFQYRKAFPLLINDWRQKWQQGNFPFYFVQLATFNTSGNSNEGCSWAELREAQTMTLQLPNTGMCVTTDIGNPFDIHPTNKQEVSRRLSALAFNNIYKKEMVCNGPNFKLMIVRGNQIIISFNNIGNGLTTSDKYRYIKGFEIAGADKIFYYANAVIKNNEVIVSCDKVSNPVAIHFGWVGDASVCNLFNKDGFPAVPFRTDEWKTVTINEKYKIEKLN